LNRISASFSEFNKIAMRWPRNAPEKLNNSKPSKAKHSPLRWRK